MPPLQSVLDERKHRGAYPTPHWLVDAVVAETVVEAVVASAPGGEVVVVDPACGDGRFLVAAARRVRVLGGRPVLVGVDIDAVSIAATRAALTKVDPAAGVELTCGDARAQQWPARVDVVVGNPPYLNQLAAATTRGGASELGGGPYADAAVEFLALSGRLVRDGGRLGLVLPQSVLASRDAAPVRAELDARGRIAWSWWSPEQVFDAQVLVCALVLELDGAAATERPGPAPAWTEIVTARLAVPPLGELASDGCLADRARLTANFRDQYYGLVGAVVEDGPGPRLVTSGLVDPARCAWGERPVTFARRRYQRPTVDLGALDPAMRRWADGLLVPKVLVANQTTVVEAVVDDDGTWLPGVPAITARPRDGADRWAVAAVLTSAVATVWAWHRAAGTGLSASAVRLGPRWLGELPWPAGDLAAAVAALRAGDVAGCGRAVHAAYGLAGDDAALGWWLERLPRRR